MRDVRVRKLMAALRRRFPETTLITGPMPDEPDSGEVCIQVLNAPMDPPTVVYDFAHKLSWELWGDEPHMGLVSPIGPEDTARYYADYVPKRRPSAGSRRRASVVAKRRRPAKSRA